MHRIDLDAAHHAALRRVVGRHENTLDAVASGLNGHGQNALDPAHLAAQRKLAHESGVGKVALELTARLQQSDQDGQIVNRAFLLFVGRRQIDRDVAEREFEPRVAQRGTHPLAGFAHRRVRQTDHVEFRHPAGKIRFDLHRVSDDAEQPDAVD